VAIWVGPSCCRTLRKNSLRDDELAVRAALERLPAVDEVEVLELRPRVVRDAVEPAAVAGADLDVVVVPKSR
jgi:hypothetical protein